MAKKTWFHWLLAISVLLAATLILWAMSPSRVLADCGTPQKSSCASCHAAEGHAEIMGEWNKVHLSQDMCINCHGGNGKVMDKDLAHEGVVAQPLSDIFTNCHSCHPADYQARANQFAVALNITPNSCATPTVVIVNADSGGLPPGGITTSSSTTGVAPSWKNYALIAGSLASLVFFFLGLAWLDGHHVKG